MNVLSKSNAGGMFYKYCGFGKIIVELSPQFALNIYLGDK